MYKMINKVLRYHILSYTVLFNNFDWLSSILGMNTLAKRPQQAIYPPTGHVFITPRRVCSIYEDVKCKKSSAQALN